MVRLTAQEKRVIDVLGDGRPHPVSELVEKCVWDELSSLKALTVTICDLRKKLKPYGQYIHCIYATKDEEAQYIHLCARSHTPNSARARATTESGNLVSKR